jgi:hypothetical protein
MFDQPFATGSMQLGAGIFPPRRFGMFRFMLYLVLAGCTAFVSSYLLGKILIPSGSFAGDFWYSTTCTMGSDAHNLSAGHRGRGH